MNWMKNFIAALVCNLTHRDEWLGLRDFERMNKRCTKAIHCLVCDGPVIETRPFWPEKFKVRDHRSYKSVSISKPVQGSIMIQVSAKIPEVLGADFRI